MTYGPKMSPTADQTSLLLTYEYEMYTFHCENEYQCFWLIGEHQLEIHRRAFIFMAVPSTLVANCGCELDATPCGCKDPVPIDKCSECQDGFWGLDEDGCRSKFFVLEIATT